MGEKNTEISARIAEIIQWLGEKPNSFAKRLGYSRAQTIYDILSGKSAPSYDFFYRFVNAEFSANINLQWLFTGEGEMLKTNPTSETLSSETLYPCSLSEHKGNINQAISQDVPPLMDRLLTIISEKDAVIRAQAEEIGRLREQIDQLKQVRGHDVSDAISSTAIAG